MRTRLAWVFGAAFVIPAAVHGQAAAESFVGSEKCSRCHPSEFRRQSESAHRSALYPVEKHPLRGAFPAGPKLVRGSAYRFDFAFAPPDFRIRIFDAADVMDLPVEWAFGAGRQAVTFVTRINRDYYVEHFGSYYPALGAYAPTPGQDVIRPGTIAEAAGVVYKTSDPESGIAGCFECHSTGPVTFAPDGKVQLTEMGVRCEACHGGRASHAADPARNRPANPKNLTATQMNSFCGRCHRPPAASGVKIDWNYAWNVRHQPVYLAESRCFQMSKGALTCLSCHDAHEPAGKKQASDYNQRCDACHSISSHPPKAVCVEKRPANCVNCHMPLVSPQPPLRFTNHWIGIYGEGAKLKPVR